MSSRPAKKAAINTAAQKGRGETQRERLIAGMILAANRTGYAGATVSAVIEQAGVSRPTFYDYFADRDECFLVALDETQAELIGQIRGAVTSAAGERATAAALTALIDFARAQPASAGFVLNEPLAAGNAALDARDAGLRQIEQIIAKARGTLEEKALTPDLPAVILFGAIYRVLGSRLRRGDPSLTSTHEELEDWITRYCQPPEKQRWLTLRPGGAPKGKAPVFETSLQRAEPLPPGRPRLRPEEVAEKHRQRILQAVAELAERKGYNATTIADIAKLAKVDPRVFYTLFSNKRDAFMGYHEHSFQRLMDVTAKAFFEGESWPERSWSAGLAFTHFLQAETLVANIGFVEAYAVGPMAVQRVDDSHVAFTIFLQEGYQYAAQEQPPGRLALEAIVAAIFEIVYFEVRGGRTGQLTRMLGVIAWFFLAPFLGVEETNRFIDARVDGGARGRRGGQKRR